MLTTPAPGTTAKEQLMSGTIKCAWCGSFDTQQGFDQATCLDCGRFTTADGAKTVATSQANEGVTVADVAALDKEKK
jgi:hypothetical protein